MKPCPGRGCSFRGDANALTSHITTQHPDIAKQSGMPQGDRPFPTVQNAPVQRIVHDLDNMNVGAPPVMNAEAVAAQNGIVLPPKPIDPPPPITPPINNTPVSQGPIVPEKDTPAILTYLFTGTHCGKPYDTLEVDVKNVHFVVAMCAGTCRKQIKETKVAKLN